MSMGKLKPGTRQVTAVLPIEVINAIQRHARREDRTFANVIRRAVLEYAKNHGLLDGTEETGEDEDDEDEPAA